VGVDRYGPALLFRLRGRLPHERHTASSSNPVRLSHQHLFFQLRDNIFHFRRPLSCFFLVRSSPCSCFDSFLILFPPTFSLLSPSPLPFSFFSPSPLSSSVPFRLFPSSLLFSSPLRPCLMHPVMPYAACGIIISSSPRSGEVGAAGGVIWALSNLVLCLMTLRPLRGQPYSLLNEGRQKRNASRPTAACPRRSS